MTISQRYQATLQEYRAAEAHYIGRLDELKTLIDAGLGDTEIPAPQDHGTAVDTATPALRPTPDTADLPATA